MARFKGTYEHTIDDKGRISLPAKLRKNMAEDIESFTLTRGHDNCLYLYPEDEWRKREDELLERLRTDKTLHRKYRRAVIGGAEEVAIDKQKRVMIPQKFLAAVNIRKDVLLIGNLDKIEIWDPGEFRAYNDQDAERSFEELSEIVMGGSGAGG
jgi:MraZ protein